MDAPPPSPNADVTPSTESTEVSAAAVATAPERPPEPRAGPWRAIIVASLMLLLVCVGLVLVAWRLGPQPLG